MQPQISSKPVYNSRFGDHGPGMPTLKEIGDTIQLEKVNKLPTEKSGDVIRKQEQPRVHQRHGTLPILEPLEPPLLANHS